MTLDYESFNVLFSRPGYGSWSSLAALAGPGYLASFGEGGYRPLTTLVYFLTRAAFGPGPEGFQGVKLALHLACGAGVWSLARETAGGRVWPAVCASAYLAAFAAPVFAGAAFVPDLLCAALALAAVRVHLRGGSPWAAAALTALAALSKETALVLPAALLACEALRPRPGLARRQLPVWAAAVVVAALAWRWGGGFYGPLGAPRPRLELLLAYARLFFRGPAAWALAVAAAGAAAARARSAWRPAAALAALAALPLLPAAGLLPYPRLAAALWAAEPRYLALPGAALACLPACLAARAALPWRAAAAALLLAAAASDAGALLRRRAGWRAELARGVEAQLAGPDGPVLGSPLCEALLSLPRLRREEPELAARVEAAVRRRLGPDGEAALEWFGDPALYSDPLKATLAMRLMRSESAARLGARARAERAYERGLAALSEGRASAALPDLESARRLDDGHLPACLASAEALARAGAPGAWTRAAGCLSARRPARPGEAPYEVELDARTAARAEELSAAAGALLRSRRYPEAREAYARAERELGFLWPQAWAARRERGLLDSGARPAFDAAMDRFAAGDAEGAARGFDRAARLAPDFGEALLSRGALRAEAGDRRGARADAARALAAAHTPELRGAAASALAAARRP